jgi:hypothetical protein
MIGNFKLTAPDQTANDHSSGGRILEAAADSTTAAAFSFFKF